CGELATAEALDQEMRTTTEATGVANVPYGALTLAAVRGQEDEFIRLIGSEVGDAKERGEGLTVAITAFLAGTVYNALGNYEVALAPVGDVGDFPEEGPVAWALTEPVEAAARLGQPERA